MTFSELKNWFFEEIKNHYTERESNNILKVLLTQIDDLKRNWSVLSLHQEFLITSKQKLIESYLPRLQQSEPLAYIIGDVDFFETNLKVDSSVLIPRPETEELVNWILEDYSDKERVCLLDIGTGSGCIPISIAAKRSNWTIKASDISLGAIKLAKGNALKNKVNVDFVSHDILKEELEGSFDIIVSNPPYISLSEQNKMTVSTIQFEPHEALFTPDDDPLLFYKRIGVVSKNALTKSGVLYFELNEFYAKPIKYELEKLGYLVELREDLQGKIRMAKCRLC